MESIVTQYTDYCLLCRAEREAMHHCIPGNANRAKSDKYKLVVPLCNFHHNLGPNSAHTNVALGTALKIIGQLAFEKEYYRNELRYSDDPARDKFRKEFGKSFV